MTMLATFGCREFQDHNDRLSAHWDTSGHPCPREKFEWAIHKFDGTVVLNITRLPAGMCAEMSHTSNLIQEFIILKLSVD